jgi:hypothetical protein
MQELGITFSLLDCTTAWDVNMIPMKEYSCTILDYYFIHDSCTVKDFTESVKQILDSKYEKANLQTLVNAMTHLSQEEEESLLNLLLQHGNLYNGTCGHWYYDSAYNIELKDGLEPYHARPHPVPRVHKATLKAEVDCLCQV